MVVHVVSVNLQEKGEQPYNLKKNKQCNGKNKIIRKTMKH